MQSIGEEEDEFVHSSGRSRSEEELSFVPLRPPPHGCSNWGTRLTLLSCENPLTVCIANRRGEWLRRRESVPYVSTHR